MHGVGRNAVVRSGLPEARFDRPQGSLRGAVPSILVALAFILLCEAVVRLLPLDGWATGEWPTSEYGRKFAEMERMGREDGGGGVVFVGSSVVDSSVDPVLFDRRFNPRVPSYNAATLGAGAGVTARWTRLAVVPSLRPSVVVVGVSSRDVNSNSGQIREHERLFEESAEIRRLAGRESLGDRLERAVAERSALLRYRSAFRQPFRLLTGQPRKEIFAFTPGPRGMDRYFLDRSYSFSGARALDLRRNVLVNFDPRGEDLRELGRLARDLVRDGVLVVFVDVPVTSDYIDAHPRKVSDYRLYQAELERAVRESGAKLIRTGVWPSRFFAEPLHVNRAGSRRFTSLLAERLRRRAFD
jgi:hypothetical protein